MLKTLVTIVKDNWQWRLQISHLALFELIKKARGTVLSWAWLFLQPLIYIFVFWFALDIGLRAGRNMNPPFFLWLITGLIPWFFMREMISSGSDVLHRFSYLVKKIKFPISGISTIYTMSALVTHLCLIIIQVVVYFGFGIPPNIYLLQVPFLIILMVIFFNILSILMSQISAMSKDFRNITRAMMTPLFWLSGIIFDPNTITIRWVHIFFLINPVTFFASAFRDAFYYKKWFWDSPHAVIGFAGVFLVTLVFMLFVYKRLNKEIPDVL